MRLRAPVLSAYATFILVGVSAGTTGVVLAAQIRDYGVDPALLGLTFITNSAGFVLAGLSTGALLHRFGLRLTMALSGVAYVLAGLYIASRPALAGLILVQLGIGYATGIMESALNAYLTELPDAPTLINRLHAFFGVGALLGPILAAQLVAAASWMLAWLVLALIGAGFLVAYLVVFPRTRPQDSPPPGGQLRAALSGRGVLLGTGLLAVYVGLELGIGNWAYTYLTEYRGLPALLAGYAVSGYWLGLTLGRFLINPFAVRIGATTTTTMYACFGGVLVTIVLAWMSPSAALTSAALIPLGFFLGPIFPTTMAIAPQLTTPRLVPTAIGVMNAGSLVGGAALPWLAGTVTQEVGLWTLLPFAAILGIGQLVVWLPIATLIRRPAPEPVPTES
ncbi:MFS transporter [Hamadaea tsunoensis]|uniref:MFS transporter n=1 Tax=Hamadaea tsunoensis TaxID=53368 RepID=UPI000403FA9E|nr:MFS transporter [Hamadaea tsunoensis]